MGSGLATIDAQAASEAPTAATIAGVGDARSFASSNL
jgi:hypothetical protein